MHAQIRILCFADIAGSFYKLKVCGNPALSDDGSHFLAINKVFSN